RDWAGRMTGRVWRDARAGRPGPRDRRVLGGAIPGVVAFARSRPPRRRDPRGPRSAAQLHAAPRPAGLARPEQRFGAGPDPQPAPPRSGAGRLAGLVRRLAPPLDRT